MIFAVLKFQFTSNTSVFKLISFLILYLLFYIENLTKKFIRCQVCCETKFKCPALLHNNGMAVLGDYRLYRLPVCCAHMHEIRYCWDYDEMCAAVVADDADNWRTSHCCCYHSRRYCFSVVASLFMHSYRMDVMFFAHELCLIMFWHRLLDVSKST